MNGGLHQIRKEINKKQKLATEEKSNNNKNVCIDSRKGLKRETARNTSTSDKIDKWENTKTYVHLFSFVL